MPTGVNLQLGDNCRSIGPDLTPWSRQMLALLQQAANVPPLPALESGPSTAYSLPTSAPPAQPGDERDELWRQFLHNPTGRSGRNARRQLIEAYAPLVKSIVFGLCRRLQINDSTGADMGMAEWSRQLSREDLQQDGMIGLIAALDKFDPRHGVNFAQFAKLKIRGAVLDALRRWWRTESAFTVQAARSATAGREPVPTRMTAVGRHQPQLDSIEFDDLVLALTNGLDSRQKAVARMWLQQQMSMAQIAAALKLHISRIGQIRRGLIAHWRTDPRLSALFR